MRKFIGSEYGTLDAFTISEGEITQPAEGEVRLKVEATALGFVDGLIALGRYQIRPRSPMCRAGRSRAPQKRQARASGCPDRRPGGHLAARRGLGRVRDGQGPCR